MTKRRLIPLFLFTLPLLFLVVSVGCDQKSANKLPATPPDQVVMRFFDLLSEGGKLTNKEAHQMISARYGDVDPDTFRRWTENFDNRSKVTITETKIADTPDKNGEIIATVLMKIATPSLFGGEFTTTSRMNLLLDKERNVWRIDFLAQTIDEEAYRNGPAEARAKAPAEAPMEVAAEAKK